ncbi:MAG TPA: hypothetical protein VMY35_12130 [Phycisphaerae bacterium]|nr:hypothetical protein [Phycisphaerae bacterium]
MARETPRQRAARTRGELAEILRCRIELLYDRKAAHARLDKLLDRLERVEREHPSEGVAVHAPGLARAAAKFLQDTR